ncbi:MAG: putative chaperone protein, partial [Oleiphilaceae bacterium]
AIRQKFGDIEILDGDHFGSVTAGLAIWAQQIYK